MRQKLPIVFISLVFASVSLLASYAMPAIADDDCNDPIAQWQPRQILKNRLEQQGWQVQRIRIDDGCYEVYAVDELGRWVKATFTPASLTLVELKVRPTKPSTTLKQSTTLVFSRNFHRETT